MTNPLLEKAKEIKTRKPANAIEWSKDEIGVIIAYLNDEITKAQACSVLGFKSGNMYQYAVSAIQYGIKKGWLTIKLNRIKP